MSGLLVSQITPTLGSDRQKTVCLPSSFAECRMCRLMNQTANTGIRYSAPKSFTLEQYFKFFRDHLVSAVSGLLDAS